MGSANKPSPIPFWCPLCVGDGSIEKCWCNDGFIECEDCEGQEFVRCWNCEGERTAEHKECQGEGWKECPRCQSHGRVYGLMPWEQKKSREGWTDDGMVESLSARTERSDKNE